MNTYFDFVEDEFYTELTGAEIVDRARDALREMPLNAEVTGPHWIDRENNCAWVQVEVCVPFPLASEHEIRQLKRDELLEDLAPGFADMT